MELSEAQTQDTVTLKSSCWFKYVDDTFVIWPRGSQRLHIFLHHLNIIHPKNSVYNDQEEGGHPLFLDIGIYRSHGSVGHKVCRKLTHQLLLDCLFTSISTPEVWHSLSLATQGKHHLRCSQPTHHTGSLQKNFQGEWVLY